jgi:hypothetical protein
VLNSPSRNRQRQPDYETRRILGWLAGVEFGSADLVLRAGERPYGGAGDRLTPRVAQLQGVRSRAVFRICGLIDEINQNAAYCA